MAKLTASTVSRLKDMARKEMNVLLTGAHGIGKTSLFYSICDELGLKGAYINVPSSDYFVDWLGIPQPETEPENIRTLRWFVERRGDALAVAYAQSAMGLDLQTANDAVDFVRNSAEQSALRFLRPKRLEGVEFVFFDEINREADPRFLDSCMEMVQFRRINGQPLHSLKIVWAAQNPPNCFAATTRFITDQGLREFSEFNHGDTAQVLDSEGLWTPAVIRNYGPAKLWRVVVERCQVRQEFLTTATHQWPVTYAHARHFGYAPRLFTTEQLPELDGKPNTRQFFTVNPSFRPELDADAVLHGIVFGGGQRHAGGYKDFGPECGVYLCNDPQGRDSRELAPLFTRAGYKMTTREDIGQIRVYGLPEYWKQLPATLEPSYLRGFVAGWYAAANGDGSGYVIDGRREHLHWLQNLAPVAGLSTSTRISEHISGETSVAPGTVTCRLGLTAACLDEEFFVHPDDAERFREPHSLRYWKIVSVEETDLVEDVWCADVPKGRLFVLEGNVLTHNSIYRVKELDVPLVDKFSAHVYVEANPEYSWYTEKGYNPHTVASVISWYDGDLSPDQREIISPRTLENVMRLVDAGINPDFALLDTLQIPTHLLNAKLAKCNSSHRYSNLDLPTIAATTLDCIDHAKGDHDFSAYYTDLMLRQDVSPSSILKTVPVFLAMPYEFQNKCLCNKDWTDKILAYLNSGRALPDEVTTVAGYNNFVEMLRQFQQS